MPSKVPATTTRGGALATKHSSRSRKRLRRDQAPAVTFSRHTDPDDPDEDDSPQDDDHDGHRERKGRRRAASGTTSRATKGSASGASTARQARRSSLPRRQSPPQPSTSKRRSGSNHASTSTAQPSKPTLRAKPDHLAPPPAQNRAGTAARHRVLSPLPTNHSIARPSHLPAKRNRDASGPARRSAAAEEPVRGTKRKRSERMVEVESESGSSGEGEELLDESASEEEEEEGDEAEDNDDDDDDDEACDMSIASITLPRRLRSADARDSDDDDGDASEEAEEPERSEPEEEEDAEYEDDRSDVDMTDEDDRFHIHDATLAQLRRLRRDLLARLYSLATEVPLADTTNLHKEPLIQGILEARPESSVVDEEEEEEDEDEEEADGAESSHPFTSHEASPVLERSPRRPKTKGSKKRSDRRATRTHVPTPPPSGAASESEESTEEEDDAAEDELALRPLKGRSQSLPALVTRPELKRPHVRTKSAAHLLDPSGPPPGPRTRRGHALHIEEHAVHLRNGKNVLPPPSRKAVKFSATASDVDEEDEGSEQEDSDALSDDDPTKPSPVAHRTRHGTTAHSPQAAPRPGRAAKNKAVARLTKSVKGKEKAVDQDAIDDDEEQSEIGMDEDTEEEEELEDVDEEMVEVVVETRHGGRTAKVPPRRAARARPRQVETPPSEADEESGVEGDDEDEVVADESEAKQVALAARQLRNGKVVPLEPVESDEESEVASSDAMSDVQEEDEEEGLDEDEGDGTEDVDLAYATSKSLLRRRRDDLVRLCEERALDGDGTKKELVNALLAWRENVDHGDSSGHSTATNATARAETKTQALNKLPPSAASSDAPLLLCNHSADLKKPQTPNQSKVDEQEEVNALDLESLQLQDKEIAPDKLTKLEKIGSGGFKDVYRGIYRKKTIAIADIRGHLTDMDIKELGLLRDLRHPNIVQFIGVSIPKEPSTVPVMIVTELCANGDLFDFIRGTQPVPHFRTVLDIMLGIAKGVEYLHTRTPSIIHRDIKSSNVLITHQGVAKINDFGLARVKTSTRSVIRSLVGTVNWQAPELWVPHPRYNEKVDVYSVGLVFWEILQWHQPVKRYPFEGMNEHAIYDSVGQKNIRPSTASIGRTWGAEILNLINAAWQGDQALRPSMQAVVVELEIIKSSTPAPPAEEKKSRR